jgi:hypothetical protein
VAGPARPGRSGLRQHGGAHRPVDGRDRGGSDS